MSEEIDTAEVTTGMDRRSVLKKAALVAGAAAFATPVVSSVFTSIAFAATPPNCNDDRPSGNCVPGTDSDALEILSAAGTSWNINCNSGGTWGKYNAQRSTFTLGELDVTLTFGRPALTDNFLVEESWYSLKGDLNGLPYLCTGTWALQTANGGTLCTGTGWTTHCSVPVPATIPAGTEAIPLPYCKAKTNQGAEDCASGGKLVLVKLVCCPI